jgi:hypothetical protein
MKRVIRMNFFFALASICILYPILLVLPFNLNAKQKLILILISFLISITGILSIDVFPLWQTLLIMVVLAGLASILVGKRMPEDIAHVTIDHANYAKVVNTTIAKDLVQNQSTFEKEEHFTRVEETKVVGVVSDEDEETIEDAILEELALLAEVQPYVSDNFLEIIGEENTINNPASLESVYEELQPNIYAAATIESDDLDLLKFEEIEEQDDSEEAMKLNIPISLHYLSEIEKLLQEEENDSNIAQKVNELPLVETRKEPVKRNEIKLEKLY